MGTLANGEVCIVCEDKIDAPRNKYIFLNYNPCLLSKYIVQWTFLKSLYKTPLVLKGLIGSK